MQTNYSMVLIRMAVMFAALHCESNSGGKKTTQPNQQEQMERWKKFANKIQRINIMYTLSMMSPFNVKYAIYYYYLLYSNATNEPMNIKREE